MYSQQYLLSLLPYTIYTQKPFDSCLALRRPGRLDREIEISAPDARTRLNILLQLVNKMHCSSNIINTLPELADATVGFVGADLVGLCNEAALSAARRHYRETAESTFKHHVLIGASTDPKAIGVDDFKR